VLLHQDAQRLTASITFRASFRMRPGSHHLISNFIDNKTTCRGLGRLRHRERRGSLGGAEKAVVDYPSTVPVAKRT